MPLRPASPRLRAALVILAVLHSTMVGAGDTDLRTNDPVVTEIRAATFDDVDAALVDAIADEGITPPTVSHFGNMLARTAPDLGHRANLYANARIYTFCSARAAAMLATESPHNIALCPLSIAVYEVPEQTGALFLSYRRSIASAGGQAANALMGRIVDRAAAQFDTAPDRPRR